MLARVALATGEDITSHQTFIEPDGSGKAEIEKPRLFSAGGKTAGGGVWFGAADPEREFIVAEGIESTLSRHAHLRRHDGMRGLVGGWRPQADPAADGAPGAHFPRPRRARPEPRGGARGDAALAR